MQKGYDLSATLPFLLSRKGMTQEQLAKKTGIVRTSITAYCTGDRRASDRNAFRIAAALEVGIGELAPNHRSSRPLDEETAAVLLREIRELRQIVERIAPPPATEATPRRRREPA